MYRERKVCVLLLLFVGCINALRISGSNGKCIIPFGASQHWHLFWPIVFNDQGQLLQTSAVDGSDSVVIPAGQSVILSCGPNYLKKLQRTEYVNAKCKNDGKFQLDNEAELKSAADLSCDLRSIQEILTDVEGCASGKTGVKFGFVNPVDHKAYLTGEACYDYTRGQTIFAHVRRGDIDEAVLEKAKSDIFKKPAPESGYKIEFMKAFRLDEFNDRLRQSLSINEVPGFDMTHFVNDRLLANRQLYSTRKLAWNYFVIHDLVMNYERLKQDIAELDGVVEVYTGTHGVATLRNSAGERKPIYLDGERFPVPEIIWVTVRHNNKAMGFAVFNDPFMTETEKQKKSFCESNCGDVSWLKRLTRDNKYAIAREGFVLCCDINEMKKTIQEIP